jgi:hypothetical protein|tara:strand:- start:501 stop:683 length:183 start_codon:yes stop_codon:yes gene_type:complete
MVYVLLLTHPYEFSEVLGVYSSQAIAEEYKTIALNSDKSNSYDEYNINEFELDQPLVKET